ncbi:MAG: redoxin domain-containing protein [Bacteroidetes bacterium]|nr:redoxin domain-containing protein [Bacteroidota bacterium]
MKNILLPALLMLSGLCHAQRDCFGQKVFDPADYMVKGYDTIMKYADIYTQSLVGCTMPSWQAVDRQGREIQPYDYQGRILFLNFWWPGCKPCIREFNSLNKLAQEYGGQVMFLSFVSGRRAQMDSVLSIHPLDFRIIPAADTLITDVFRMSIYPTNMIIGRDGRVAYIMHGGQVDDGLSNYEKIKPALVRAIERR